MQNLDKLQEIQILEQSLQQILLQKQAFQMELNETETALKNVEDAGDEIYKTVGQLLIKSEKTKIIEELSNKKRILDLRLKSLEKQESSLSEQLENNREKVLEKNKK